MNLEIINLLSANASSNQNHTFDNGEFAVMVKSAVEQRISVNGENAASPVTKETQSSDKAEELRTLFELLEKHRRCAKKERPESPTAEELKAVAKARARRKARLDAYFHLLEKVCIKRKLIEQENAKRTSRKKYRSVTEIGVMVKSQQITAPPKNPEYFF